MQPAVIQNVSLAFLAFATGSGGVHGGSIATGSAASFEWETQANVPTQVSTLTGNSTAPLDHVRSAVGLMALADASLPGSRSFADWERRDADESFWSHFE